MWAMGLFIHLPYIYFFKLSFICFREDQCGMLGKILMVTLKIILYKISSKDFNILLIFTVKEKVLDKLFFMYNLLLRL